MASVILPVINILDQYFILIFQPTTQRSCQNSWHGVFLATKIGQGNWNNYQDQTSPLAHESQVSFQIFECKVEDSIGAK